MKRLIFERLVIVSLFAVSWPELAFRSPTDFLLPRPVALVDLGVVNGVCDVNGEQIRFDSELQTRTAHTLTL